MLKALGTTVPRSAGLGAGLLGTLAAAVLAAPTASAAPDCSSAGLSNTVNSVTGSAQQYLANHPGADAAITQATSQPRPEAAADVRSYFTAHPLEYYQLRDILAPIDEAQRQCHTTVLPPELASAYQEFMTG